MDYGICSDPQLLHSVLSCNGLVSYLTMYLLSIHDSYYVFGTNCSIYVLVQNANGSERCEFVTNMSGLMFLVLFFLAENLKSPPLFFNVVSAIAYFSLLNTENGTKSFLQF